MHEKIKLSFAQQRLFFVEQSSIDKALFNIPIVLRLKGNLSIPSLQKSFLELLNRHDILRLKICQDDGELYGIIKRKEAFNLQIININIKNEEEILQLIKGKISKKIDLLRDNLFQAYLVVLGADEYILTIVLHHIITDEWSNSILLHELSDLYAFYEYGTVSNLPVEEGQYSDYVLQEEKLYEENFFSKEIKFWKHYLEGAPELILLPTDKPRPNQLTYEGGNYTIKLPHPKILEIRKFCTAKKVTLFGFLITIFKCFLYRYSGEKDIVIGYPNANRALPEIENLIGLFVNIIPIRSLIIENQTFEEFLYETKKNLIEGYENQNFPFHKLVEDLDINRKQNYNPIFQILFVLHGEYNQNEIFENFNKESIEIGNEVAKFDLSLFCKEDKDGLSVVFNYSKDLFYDSTIEILAKAFINIIDSVLKQSNILIKDIPFTSEDDKKNILQKLDNKTEIYDYENLRIHYLFKECVLANPKKIAIIADNKEYSYELIDEVSDNFATYLINKGCAPGTVVALSLEPGLELVISILAILKIGAIYLPINLDYPKERMEYMLQDSNSKILITKFKYLDKFKDFKGRIIDLKEAWDSILNTKKIIHANQDNEIMAVIYTSGSTGKQKGVLYKHSSVCNRFLWLTKSYPFDQDETCILISNVSFVDFITELFMPLLAGVKVVIAPSNTGRNLEELVAYLVQYKITRINLVPSLLAIILDDEEVLKKLIPNLRHWEISGEIFANNLMVKTLKKLKNIKLINRYGSTEATSVIYNELNLLNNDIIDVKTRVIANTRIYVLDKNRQLLPYGLRGEIYIAGAALAKGYLNDKNLTDTKFIKNPFSNNNEDIIYRTGDIGNYNQDGSINVLGRIDSQIKINGFRIELREIEIVLQNHENINLVVVLAKEEGEQLKIVAYITCKNYSNNIEDEFHAYLKECLPEYMIPSSFVIIDKFPKNVNGKIDLKALKDINSDKLIIQKRHVAPRNIKEYKMSKLWEEVLNVKKISIDDDFFKIGGNSILAIRLIAKIQKEFSTSFPIANIYKYSTIKGMVENLEDKVSNLYTNLVLPIQHKGNNNPIFLVHPARGLSFPYTLLNNYIEDIPIYGISHPIYSNDPISFDTVEEMAQYYINAIQTIKKEGPYCLGGWSFGGLVALEMAQQLVRANKKVSLLILFDTSNYPKEYMTDLTEQEIEKGLIRIGINTQSKEAEFFRRQSKTSDQLLQKYIPRKYEGRVALIKAQDDEFANAFRQNDIFQGWKDIFGRNMEIYSTPGQHNTLWNNEYVANIANIIKFIINNPEVPNILKDKSLSFNQAYLNFALKINDEFMIKRLKDLSLINNKVLLP